MSEQRQASSAASPENLEAPDVHGRAAAELIPLFYEQLRASASRERRRLRSGDTMNTTVLINEVWLRLRHRGDFNDRAHFLSTAARAMRSSLIDYLRDQSAQKRGSGNRVLTLIEDATYLAVYDGADNHALLELSDLLDKLAVLNPRLTQVVECRVFAGMTEAEIAEALSVTERTVRRDWVKASAWLRSELGR